MVEVDAKIELPFDWCKFCDAMDVEHWTDKYEYRGEYDVLRVEYRSGFACKNEAICEEANRARIKDVLQNEQMIE